MLKQRDVAENAGNAIVMNAWNYIMWKST